MTKEEFAKYLKDNHPSGQLLYEIADFLKKDDYYAMLQLYYAFTKKLPHILQVDDTDISRFFDELIADFELEKNPYHKSDFYTPYKNLFERNRRWILLTNDLLISFGLSSNNAIIFYSSEVPDNVIEYLKEYLKQFPLDIKLFCNMFVLTEDNGKLRERVVDMPEEEIKCDIKVNYNDDFLPIHDLIFNRLSTNDDKGIVLLHGLPGTGKTTYIRYLVSKIRKNFIIIPSTYAHYLGSKEFMTFLMGFKNAILILEDAEEAIKTRSHHSDSAVTNLLNLSDGLFSDVLKMQVIVTCNIIALKDIDSALLRKGRLIARYNFRALKKDKAERLMDSLGNNVKVETDMTLADIYNQSDMDFQIEETNKIGFSNNV